MQLKFVGVHNFSCVLNPSDCTTEVVNSNGSLIQLHWVVTLGHVVESSPGHPIAFRDGVAGIWNFLTTQGDYPGTKLLAPFQGKFVEIPRIRYSTLIKDP